MHAESDGSRTRSNGPADEPANGLPNGRQAGIWANLLTGLKVVGSELRWIALGRLRAFEVRQLRRRLDREYETLGRLAEPILSKGGGKAAEASTEAVDLCLKQIEFLRDEIALLDGERDRSRQRFERRRAREMGVDPESDQ